MTLIVGLGNPTKRYENTRHNAGFLAADEIIRRLKPANISKAAFKGELYKACETLILKPLTYMNLSGESVLAVKNFYKLEKIIVIHDDLDLAFGALRFKFGGSGGGHNGLRSIDALCGSDYFRARMGIGRPNEKESAIDYVLGSWNEDQKAVLSEWIEAASNAALALISDSLESVQSTLTRSGMIQNGQKVD
ncbi:MAG: aminoacyl-tRNA hydrolase [Helicobacteraceae bacterium]|jgi:PTH1 family peptidyl-tRNA hydrolase|nr:aminoacyl-tRNA hydrolase [Helicobacteraceae bacterium]